MYDLRDIIGELAHFDGLPRAALEAARERRNELIGPLLQEIERATREPHSIDPDANLVFFAFLLMGEWREASAYRPLARFLRIDQDALDVFLGDSVTETAHRVMAAVFDGDPGPLRDIILDADADEYVRSRMCETLAMLVVTGRLPREQVVDLLREAYPRLKSSPGDFVWNGWQEAVAMLGAVELKPLVKEAFDAELIDPRITSFDYFEGDLAYALAHPDQPWQRSEEYQLWGNTAEELSSWYGFSEKYREARKRESATLPPVHQPIWDRLGEPYVNALRGVGRNDPCPCGSGKKYKKCCLE